MSTWVNLVQFVSTWVNLVQIMSTWVKITVRVFVSNYRMYLSEITKCICLKLQSVFVSNYKIYSSQITKYICLKLQNVFVCYFPWETSNPLGDAELKLQLGVYRDISQTNHTLVRFVFSYASSSTLYSCE